MNHIRDTTQPRERHMNQTDLDTCDERTPKGERTGHLAERGLTTVEYAIGLVAAATAAVVLLRIFSDNTFYQMLQDWILVVFQRLAMVI